MNTIFLNGPPGSGKDTVAGFIKDCAPAAHLTKFAEPLRASLRALLGVTDEELEELKRRHPGVRKAMIYLSEDFVKPTSGPSFFAVRLAQEIALLPDDSLIVVSDSGFAYEVDAFLTELSHRTKKPVSAQLLRIHRPGCSFQSDSRSYLSAASLSNKVAEYDLLNSMSLEEMKLQVRLFLSAREEKWQQKEND